MNYYSRFRPLKNVLIYDVFNNGFNGWMEIMPNFNERPYFEESPSILKKDQWMPAMLSSATYRYPGSHGSLSGQYSLKISTRAVANKYEEMPAPGSMGQGIKRISFHHSKRRFLQMEIWFAYTAEQDKVDGEGELPGLHENSIRAFGMGWDIQERGQRFFPCIRYLNSVNGSLKKQWQFSFPSALNDKEWAYDTDNDWCRKGVDPFWFGKRYPDGRHEAFKTIKNGKQNLIYNETDCKINWQYLRLLINTERREYIEMQCQDKVFSLNNHSIYTIDPYERIDGLINPLVWIETDTNRRVFLYVDSVIVSQE